MSTGYKPGTIPPVFDDAYRQPIPSCGSDGVLPVDGRLNAESIAAIARRECIPRKSCGYQVFQGESFTASRAISGYWSVSTGAIDNSASSATYGA